MKHPNITVLLLRIPTDNTMAYLVVIVVLSCCLSIEQQVSNVKQRVATVLSSLSSVVSDRNNGAFLIFTGYSHTSRDSREIIPLNSVKSTGVYPVYPVYTTSPFTK